MPLMDVEEGSLTFVDLQSRCKPSKYLKRSDKHFSLAADNYKIALETLKRAQETADAMKAELLEACEELQCQGEGLTIQRIERKGAVDYASIGVLKEVDLELYRKPSSESWRITVDTD